jgi:nucleoside-diphosphate-sugar epimerase
MKVLVIGGTRFIGPRVVKRLTAAGHEVAVLHRGQHDVVLPRDVMSIIDPHAGIPVTAFPDRALRFEPQVVLHMICMGERDGAAARTAFERIAHRIVMASSGDVYRAYGYFSGIEPGPAIPTPLKEISPLRTTRYPYRTETTGPEALEYFYDKILAERQLSASKLLPATILRLPKLYGRGDNEDLATVYGFRNHPTWRWTHGYVENVAAAIALAVTAERAGGRVYNVGEEHTPTIQERLGYLPARPDAPIIDKHGHFDQDISYDTSAIRSELGFKEIVPERDAMIRVASEHLSATRGARPRRR